MDGRTDGEWEEVRDGEWEEVRDGLMDGWIKNNLYKIVD